MDEHTEESEPQGLSKLNSDWLRGGGLALYPKPAYRPPSFGGTSLFKKLG